MKGARIEYKSPDCIRFEECLKMAGIEVGQVFSSETARNAGGKSRELPRRKELVRAGGSP
jgi:hypothetical protein